MHEPNMDGFTRLEAGDEDLASKPIPGETEQTERSRGACIRNLNEKKGQSEHQHFKRCSIDVLNLSKTPSGEITNVVSDFFFFFC